MIYLTVIYNFGSVAFNRWPTAESILEKRNWMKVECWLSFRSRRRSCFRIVVDLLLTGPKEFLQCRTEQLQESEHLHLIDSSVPTPNDIVCL